MATQSTPGPPRCRGPSSAAARPDRPARWRADPVRHGVGVGGRRVGACRHRRQAGRADRGLAAGMNPAPVHRGQLCQVPWPHRARGQRAGELEPPAAVPRHRRDGEAAVAVLRSSQPGGVHLGAGHVHGGSRHGAAGVRAVDDGQRIRGCAEPVVSNLGEQHPDAPAGRQPPAPRGHRLPLLHPAGRREPDARIHVPQALLLEHPLGGALHPGHLRRPGLAIPQINHVELNVQREVHSGVPRDRRFLAPGGRRSTPRLPVSNIMAGRAPRVELSSGWELSLVSARPSTQPAAHP